MKIIGVTTERFRNLPDRTWPFDPRFQIVRGPNEAGKSALHEAIRIALFASATSQDQRYVLARRWGSPDPIRLALHVQVADGTYQLIRDFATRKNALIRPDGTRRPEADLVTFLQGHFPFPTEATFLATACVEQDELIRVRRDGRALQPLLEQHTLAGTPANIAELVRQLERRLAEIRRGMERGAPRNPGPLRQHTEALDRLRGELATLRGKAALQSEAAEALARVREELEGARAALRTRREHLARHIALGAAEEQRQAAEARLRRALTGLDQIRTLDVAIPRLREEHAKAAQTLADHRTRTERAEAYARVAEEIATAETELEALTGGLDTLATLDRTIAELTAERQGLPLTLDDLTNLRALPGEIAGLTQTVEAADCLRAEQTARRVAAAAELAAAQDVRAILTTVLDGRREALARATRYRDRMAELDILGERLGTLTARLARVQPLAAALGQKRGARAALANLDPLSATLPTLQTRIATFQQVLEGQFIEAEVRPRQPLDLTTQADGDPPEHTTTTEPVTVLATRRIELALAPWADITIVNQSEAAHSLVALEEERRALLNAAGCASVADAEERLAARAGLDAEIVTLDRRLLAELGRDTLTALVAEAEALRAAHEAAAATLAGLPVVEEAPETIQADLEGLPLEIAQAEGTISARTAEVATLAQALATDPVGPVRTEIERKGQALAALRMRLGAEMDPASLEVRHQELSARLEAAQQARDATLDGRLPAGMERRAAALRAALGQLCPRRDALAEDATTPEALAAAQEALPGLAQAVEEANQALQEALAERKMLDRAALEQEQRDAVVAITTAQTTIAEWGEFRLAPAERIALEARVQDLEKAIPRLEKEEGALEERSAAASDLREQIAQREERVAVEERQLRAWTARVNADTEILALVQAARAQAVTDLADRILPETAGRYLARVTGGRHGDVRQEDGEYRVWAAAKSAALADEEFSGGTRDQFYLALRLAHLEALCTGERPPLLLDDPLVHCDSDRRGAVLALLAEYAEHGQVLLFTCHDFPQYGAYAMLTVE